MEVLAKQWVDRCENKRPDVALFPAYKDKGFIFDVFVGKSNANFVSDMDIWLAQYTFYDYKSNKCQTNCERFRQVGYPSAFHFAFEKYGRTKRRSKV